jgi:hypothetical protein
MRTIQRLAELTRPLTDIRHPELSILGKLIRAVIGKETTRSGGVDLEPAARVQSLICPAEELGGVGDAAAEFAGVDVVKGTAVSPFGFEVVDLKDAVGRSPGCMVRKRSLGGNYSK